MVFWLFRSRGATGKACSGRTPRTPQEEARDRKRRLAYLHRLGIQQSRGSGSAKTVIEDDEQSVLESISCASSFSGDEAVDGGENFRHKFLRKLAYEKVWVTELHRSPKHQTVIIFDWDDTLICSSWLNRHRVELSTGKVEAPLEEMGKSVRGMLEMAVRMGHTYIITNAMPGWVEHSAARWAPELLPILRRIPIISARARFEPAFPDDVEQWKVQAFLSVKRQLADTSITNLIALGDADFEMEAARIMGGEFEEAGQAFVKTVKFWPNPTPLEHLIQVQLVASRFPEIVEAARGGKFTLRPEQIARQHMASSG